MLRPPWSTVLLLKHPVLQREHFCIRLQVWPTNILAANFQVSLTLPLYGKVHPTIFATANALRNPEPTTDMPNAINAPAKIENSGELVLHQAVPQMVDPMWVPDPDPLNPRTAYGKARIQFSPF